MFFCRFSIFACKIVFVNSIWSPDRYLVSRNNNYINGMINQSMPSFPFQLLRCDLDWMRIHGKYNHFVNGMQMNMIRNVEFLLNARTASIRGNEILSLAHIQPLPVTWASVYFLPSMTITIKTHGFE